MIKSIIKILFKKIDPVYIRIKLNEDKIMKPSSGEGTELKREPSHDGPPGLSRKPSGDSEPIL